MGVRRWGVVVALVILGICTGCSPDAAAGSAPPEHPTGAEDLVLAVRPRGKGGQYDRHSYWLYGNRRLIVVEYGPRPSAEPRGYTGEPFQIETSRILTTRVSQARMGTLLRKVEAAGLLGARPPEFGKPLQFEGYYNVVVHAGGVDREVTYIDSRDEDDPRLTRAQEERRQIIGAMTELMFDAVNDGEGSRYSSDRVALLVKRAEEKLTADNSRVVKWPLRDLDRAVTWPGSDDRGDRCLMASAEQADVVIDTLTATSAEAVAWLWNGELYRVWPHPLLPHETSCQTLHPYFSFIPDKHE